MIDAATVALLAQEHLDHLVTQIGCRMIGTAGNEQAHRLYERCGFVTFGVEPLAVAYGDRYVAKTHMWCDLAAASP